MTTPQNGHRNGSNGALAKQNETDSTPAWESAFLAALEETGVISKAAEAAQIGRKAVWTRRKNNPGFAKEFDDALRAGALLLEAEAIRRAQDGVVRMKFNPKSGKPYIDPRTITPECPEGLPYMEHEYSDTLMAILLKRHFPEYREPKSETHVSTTLNNFLVMTAERSQQLQDRLKSLEAA